jgi:hypothetical protein
LPFDQARRRPNLQRYKTEDAMADNKDYSGRAFFQAEVFETR